MIGKKISQNQASADKKAIRKATFALIIVALILGIISNLTSSGIKKKTKTKKKENKKVELYTEPTATFGEGDVIPTVDVPTPEEEGD